MDVRLPHRLGRGDGKLADTTERGSEIPDEVKLSRWLEPANRVVISLRRLGLAIGTMRLFSVPGRRSGELRTTPVSPLTMSGLRYVVGLQDADWVKNARTAGWGILTCGRNEERVVLVELPPEERAPVLRAFPREVPHGVRVLCPAGDRGFSRLGGFRSGRAAVRCLPHRGLAEQRR